MNICASGLVRLSLFFFYKSIIKPSYIVIYMYIVQSTFCLRCVLYTVNMTKANKCYDQFLVVVFLNPWTRSNEWKQWRMILYKYWLHDGKLSRRENQCRPRQSRGWHWFSMGYFFPRYPLVQSIFIIVYWMLIK